MRFRSFRSADDDVFEHEPFPAFGDHVWIKTRKSLEQWKDGKLTKFATPEEPFAHHPAPLFQDRDGGRLEVWVGTSDGLNRFKDGAITLFLPHVWVPRLFVDREGTFWVSTGSLNRWKDGKFTSVTRKQGLLYGVNGMEEDDQGNLWLMSDKGISRVSKAELHALRSRAA